jgi:hypothetical protein
MRSPIRTCVHVGGVRAMHRSGWSKSRAWSTMLSWYDTLTVSRKGTERERRALGHKHNRGDTHARVLHIICRCVCLCALCVCRVSVRHRPRLLRCVPMIGHRRSICLFLSLFVCRGLL